MAGARVSRCRWNLLNLLRDVPMWCDCVVTILVCEVSYVVVGNDIRPVSRCGIGSGTVNIPLQVRCDPGSTYRKTGRWEFQAGKAAPARSAGAREGQGRGGCNAAASSLSSRKNPTRVDPSMYIQHKAWVWHRRSRWAGFSPMSDSLAAGAPTRAGNDGASGNQNDSGDQSGGRNRVSRELTAITRGR